jgi:hypothetical protein
MDSKTIKYVYLGVKCISEILIFLFPSVNMLLLERKCLALLARGKEKMRRDERIQGEKRQKGKNTYQLRFRGIFWDIKKYLLKKNIILKILLLNPYVSKERVIII